ncbi:MBL fold metallo-hydrolase [Nocardia flavorosea]|uniref:MBL fold metallo-hydrolase n=1 Tax=Nocardia flavorosea TaxID=53429 RepID=A0A846YUD1_9NOCA|nr:MBL fold metallo-hydrolase [Nocardia flavorosea]NKY60599.1 MBL fold metallo-hydrolase [Nocardia flavorosea]
MPASGSHDWTRPGIYEVGDGIFRIPLSMPNDGLRAVNVYAVISDDELGLVDGGWADPNAQQELAAALARIGRSIDRIATIAVTHAHRDHYTLAVSLRARYGSRIALGRREGPTIAAMIDGSGRGLDSQGGRLIAADAADLLHQLAGSGSRAPQGYVTEEFGLPDRWLDDGDPVRTGSRTLRAVHTPGHTDGHMVFVEETARLLFSGDHILPTITPSVGFEPRPTPDPLGAYLESLRIIADGPALGLLPSHGPVIDDAGRRARELIDHHAERLDRIRMLCADGLRTARAIAHASTWTRRDRRFHELGLFDQVLAVVETLVHLDHLAFRGELRCGTGKAGPNIYTTE